MWIAQGKNRQAGFVDRILQEALLKWPDCAASEPLGRRFRKKLFAKIKNMCHLISYSPDQARECPTGGEK
jgi:hypothetical protein